MGGWGARPLPDQPCCPLCLLHALAALGASRPTPRPIMPAACRAFWEELAAYSGSDPLEVWLRCRQLAAACLPGVPGCLRCRYWLILGSPLGCCAPVPILLCVPATLRTHARPRAAVAFPHTSPLGPACCQHGPPCCLLVPHPVACNTPASLSSLPAATAGSSAGRRTRLARGDTRRSCCRCWSGAPQRCRGKSGTSKTSGTCGSGSSM